jgi:hypothetical protein
MGEYQLLLDGVAVGPIRRSWEEAAEDAVLAGVAEWVNHDFPNSRAIAWSRPGRACIANLQTRPLAVVDYQCGPRGNHMQGETVEREPNENDADR